MLIQKTKIKDSSVIWPKVFEDFRGPFFESYNRKNYQEIVDKEFVQDNFSYSDKHVLRGIHGDYETYKLVSCIQGRVYVVILDCREGEFFGQWESFVVSESNRFQILIPPGVGCSYLVLSDGAIFHYKQSTYYDKNKQFSYKWNDIRFGIVWPIKNPILSARDS